MPSREPSLSATRSLPSRPPAPQCAAFIMHALTMRSSGVQHETRTLSRSIIRHSTQPTPTKPPIPTNPPSPPPTHPHQQLFPMQLGPPTDSDPAVASDKPTRPRTWGD